MIRDSLEYNASIPNLIHINPLQTDIGSLHDFGISVAYHQLGLVNLIGVCMSEGLNTSGNIATAFLRYGHVPNALVFTSGSGVDGDSSVIAYNAAMTPESYPSSYLGIVAGYRKLLASAPNGSVIISENGPATSIISLLQSTADIYSPLTGPQLIAQKVKMVIMMGGVFGGSHSFTCTSASPGVLTVGVSLANGTPIVLCSYGGALPIGLSASPTYYVVNSNNSTTIEVAASPGGTPINTSSTGTGTLYAAWYGSGGYEYNFVGTNWATLQSLWPSTVPFVLVGIELSDDLLVSPSPNNLAPTGSPYYAVWSTTGNETRNEFSFAGFYWAFGDRSLGNTFYPGGLNGTLTSLSSNAADSWSQSPAGPWGYIIGNWPNTYTPGEPDWAQNNLAVGAKASKYASALFAMVAMPTIGNNPPLCTVLPTIAGPAQVGQALTCSSTWQLANSLAYQWFWSDTSANISGATSATYVPVTSDIGHPLKCTITATGGGGVVSATTATATADVIAAYTLTGSFTLNPTGPVNLTTEGSTDWIVFGYSSTTSVDRKSSGGSVLGAISGVTSPTRNNQGSTGLTWTDGTPDSTVTDELYYAYSAASSMQFTAPAGTSSHTLYVYVGQYNCPTSFTAHLSDSSSPDYVSTASMGGGWNAGLFVLTYHAGSAGQTLTITFGSTNGSPAYIAGAALV